MKKIYTIDYILENEIDKNLYGFIYITTNLINGKRYIGQRKFSNCHGGWQHYLGSGMLLKKAIKKYNREKFKRDIIDIAYSEEELNQKEIQWIKQFNAAESDNFYNIVEGGGGGNPWLGKTKEEIAKWKQKLSEANKGENHPFYGKKLSEEHKRKISDGHKGMKYSEKTEEEKKITRQKISKKLSGENHPFYGKRFSKEHKRKISDGHKGMKYSEDTKRKKSASMKGKNKGKRSEETRKAMSENRPKKAVIQLSLDDSFITLFPSIREVERQTGINNTSISLCCRSKAKTAGSYKWMYYEDYIEQQNQENLIRV